MVEKAVILSDSQANVVASVEKLCPEMGRFIFTVFGWRVFDEVAREEFGVNKALEIGLVRDIRAGGAANLQQIHPLIEGIVTNHRLRIVAHFPSETYDEDIRENVWGSCVYYLAEQPDSMLE
jgi:hypothetical protein